MHISYGSEEESAENLELSEGYLPLCFTSFHFIKDNFHAIRNQQSLRIDLDNQEDNEILDHSSLPLCFSSFVKIRENYEQANKWVIKIINDKHYPELVEEIIRDIEPSLDPDLQPPNAIEY